MSIHSLNTTMHSSRVRTACSLTVSRSICHTHPPPPCMPPLCHACPPAMHAPCHTPPHHTHTPAMHAPAMHAPCHACHPAMHAPFTTHAPPVDRILDTRFWKYYLAPTSLRAVMKTHEAAKKENANWNPDGIFIHPPIHPQDPPQSMLGPWTAYWLPYIVGNQ